MDRPVSTLDAILARKRHEIRRRERLLRTFAALADGTVLFDPSRTLSELRRPPGAPLRVVAEVKHSSPSAGVIRPRVSGDVARIARGYVSAGASAVSVLADGPGFAGSVLDVRRASRAVRVPVLFKDFVLSSVQLDVARAAGASMVLLLVRALEPHDLAALVAASLSRGLLPLVEAADAGEVDAALDAGARLVGVNARDLATFTLDVAAAEAALERMPEGRVAMLLSGVRTADDVKRIATTRADAILVGTELMSASDPAERLRELVGA